MRKSRQSNLRRRTAGIGVLGCIALISACGGDAASSPGDGGATDAGPSIDGAADAAPSEDAPAETAPPPPQCDPIKPFAAPILVGGVNSGTGDLEAWLSDDEFTIYFATSRHVGHATDIYTSTRNEASDPFNAPVAILGAIDTVDAEHSPRLSADESSLYFESSKRVTGSTSHRIFVATRALASDPFANVVVVPVISAAATEDDVDPSLGFPRGMYFASNRAGSTGYDLYRAHLGAGGFEAPAIVAGVSSASAEQSPVPSIDELTLFWASDRADGGAKGADDIWMATRATPGAPFSAPHPVLELNTALVDRPNWLSPDGCTLYFSSTRSAGTDAGPAGTSHIWKATRPK
ncbi:MAG: hypothetical protein ABIP39_14525 [Polyangiaceae bacterium]